MTHNSRYRKQKWVRQFSQKALGIILFALVLLILAGGGFAHGGNAKYIILFIGDGFGSKHIEAVNKYNGDTAPLYQSGPPWVKYMVSTFPEGGSYNTTEAWSDFDYVNTTPDTQDSACTASAIYSGSKTSLGRMSVSSDGSTRLFTIGERAKELGKAVGAISTVPASHATPGAWVAHNDSRINTFAIADEGFFGNPNTTGSVTTNTKYGGGHGSTMPPADVMIGGNVTNYISDQILNKLRTESGQAGKHVLVERKTGVNGGNALMSAANTSSTLKLAGLFNQVYHNANGGGYNSDNPTLSESVLATVKVLSRNPNGFVLMVEGGAIDWASHANNMNQMIGEAKDFYNAIQTVTDWVNDTGNDATWNNTLVIVTADHETGYLTAGPGILADQPLGNVDSTTLSKEKIVYNTGGRKASWEDANSNYLIDTGETVYWYWNSGNHTNSLVPLYARGTGSELFVHYAINIDSVRGPYLDNTDVFSVMNSAIAIAGTATKVAFVQQPTNTTAGAAISPAVTVQLQDDSGNNVYTSDVSVTISLSSGTGVLSGTAVQKTNASGLATFSGLSIDLAGSKNLTATSAGLMSAVSNAFTISDTTPQVAYYRFDESSGTNAADSSGNGNNGVLINGPVWTTGKISNALSFDGVNDYVSTADTPFDFERTNSFSVSAWIKLAPTTLENPIVSKDGAAPSYTGWSFYVEPGSLRVFLTNKWNSPSNGIVKDSAIQVDDNVWHHVAFTYDGTSLASGVNIYIDGNLSNGTVTRNNLSASILNDVPLSIGALAGTSIAFNGLIDDVQIYNRALSGQEVLSLFNNATTPDTTPPEVSATSPVSDATEVEINSAITCTFSEEMDASSITSSTFVVSDGSGNIGGAILYSGTTATFAPTGNLSSSTTYTATITTGVKDVVGNGMTGDYVWSFTTGVPDTTPPTVIATSPVSDAAEVEVNSAITCTFSEEMYANSITPSTFLVSDRIATVSGIVYYVNQTAMFMPFGSLSYSTTYTATITTGVKDVAGNGMTANYVWSFTTGAPDTTPPTVSATSPISNATEVEVNSAITCTFSEAMDANSITTATILVSDGSSNIGGTVSYSGTTATFAPTGNLSSSTTYTTTITTGVKDVAGNGMAANYVWSFTTGAVLDATLQAYYAFDEGTGVTVTDSSGNNRNGTITGATWTTGKIGGALNFDGNDYVTIPSMNYEEISVSAWFNKNTSGTNVIFGGFRYNADVQLREGFDLYFNSSTPNILRFVAATRNTSWTRTVKDATKDFTDSNGSWYHVVGTYNKTTGEQKLYVDGQLVDTQTHPSGNVIVPLTDRNYMAIGTRYTNFGFFRGIIDDIRIYNRALSAQEVLSLFNNATTPDTTPPTVSATSPVSNATEVAVNSTITCTFSEAMDASSITTATFLVSDGISNIGGAVSYSGTTATFTPSGNLSSSTTYTATITTGVKDVAGNGMTADYVWSFTTGAPDTTPPTVSATSPVSNATEVAVNSTITCTFSEAMDASSITTATFLVSDGISNIGGAVSYSGTTATFTPSGNLSSSTTYTTTITTGVKDVAGNGMTADYVWSFTTGAAPDPTLQAYYAFDEGTGATATDSSGNNRNGTITGATWTTGKIGGALNFDGNDYVTIPSMNYEEISVSAWFNKNTSGTNVIFGGFRYNADVQLREGFDLYFNSSTPNILRFVAATRNTSWTRTVKDATKDFTDSNGSWYHVVGTYNKTTGEQKLYVDGQLVDTQTHPSGNVIVPLTDRNYMAIGTRYTNFGFFRGIIDDIRIYNRALSAQEVLSLFNNATTPDTTPPTVSATSPVSNATEVAVNSTITCTFSEAMDASSITTATFLVSDGISNIGGAVSYSGTTATFTPSGNLSSSTTYTTTITTGVKDVAGNGMTADYVWSFTTGAAPDPTLQAYYAFDEGTGATATDSSGNNRNGTITGATWTTGKIGGALNFDGNDYVTIPSMNYEEISVSAWFNKNTSGTNVIFGGFRYNADVQLREGFDLYFNSSTPNILRFVAATRNTSGTRTVKDVTKDFTESNGSWYHVVGTYNKTTGEQKLYVDGQLVDTQTHPSGNVIVPLTDRNYMAIGTRYTNFGFFRGIIDDIRIYNRALSAQEVLSLFNNSDHVVLSLFSNTVIPDTTSPEVSAWSPASGATGVAVDSVITGTFNEEMDAGSITPSTFLVSDGVDTIGGTVSYSGTTATFIPSGNLSSSTTYTATITTGVKDLAGNAMASDYIWSFTTDDMYGTETITMSLSEGPGGQQVHYAFDEGTGAIVTDSSDNNKNGTITGFTGSTWTTGKFGRALSFNGESTYVSIPPLNYDEISVSAWFYRYSVDTEAPDTIFGGWYWNSGGQGYGLYFDQYSASRNTIRFIVTTKTSEGTKTQKHATNDLVTSTGKWYHVAGTYNKTTGEQKLYVDGQLVDTQTHPAGNTIVPYTAASYMAIGALTSNYGHMDGKIDEVVVYNRELSAGEVLSLRFYNTTMPDTTPLVRITTPDNYYLQENSDLSVQAETNNLQQNQGILFALDSGTAYAQSISDYTAPYEVVFTNLSRGEYVMDAFVVDAEGNKIPGEYAHDKRVQIGIGDYYWGMGDGITIGIGDDDVSDDTSQDGRNAGGGYPPILNNLLTAARGYPHTIFNEGVEGSTSSDGASSINRMLLRHPNASGCLVQYGTNDANPLGLPIPSGLGLNPGDPGYPGTFKDNMQKISEAINAAGQKACLAKVPIALGDSSGTYHDPDQTPRNILIKEYNQVVDELKSNFSNNILIIPPDFYSYFNYSDVPTERRRYEDEYADLLHPNGIGYRSMSNLWFQALTQ